jgi:hypothetical protein
MVVAPRRRSGEIAQPRWRSPKDTSGDVVLAEADEVIEYAVGMSNRVACRIAEDRSADRMPLWNSVTPFGCSIK